MVRSRGALAKSTAALSALVIIFASIAGFSTLRPAQEGTTVVRTLTTTVPGQERVVTVTTTAQIERTVLPLEVKDYFTQREKQLYEAAKKEGKVAFYSAQSQTWLELLKKAFEAKYAGVTVEVVRAEGATLLQRVLSEYRSGTHVADVFNAVFASSDILLKENLIASYVSPEALVYHPDSRSEFWVAWLLSPQSISYNTKLVSRDDVPKQYWDVLHPKFKGKIAIADPTTRPWNLLAMKEKVIGKERWPEFVRGLCGQQARVIASTGALNSLLISGEIALALWQFVGTATDEIKKGAPVEYVRHGTVISDVSPALLYKHAPHPNAARLFYDFIISKEGATVMAETGAYPMIRPEVPQLVGVNVGVGIPVDAQDIKVPSPHTLEEREAIVKEWAQLMKC